MKRIWIFGLLVVIAGIIIAGIYFFRRSNMNEFNGTRAFDDVKYQVSLGPRTPGSLAHQKVREWIQSELNSSGWFVEQQNCPDCFNLPVFNIIGKRGSSKPWIILGAHFDSRISADHDPDVNKRSEAVPAANDGASGVAVLLELARILPRDMQKQIWLVFIDVEDDGEIKNYDWLYGSRAFVDWLKVNQDQFGLPDQAIIVDMIGDKDLNIYYEGFSNPQIREQIWSQANLLGYDQFIPRVKYSMLDDHTPFLEAGIPAVDIIDFDYPYYHTMEDTIDKVSAQSLEAVGRTLAAWLSK